MENNFLAITSAMMVTLNQNLTDIGTHKELIVLNILKYKYCVNQSHMSRDHFAKNSKFNLELFKTSILNFAYIHYKRRKSGMFILFQKC